MTPAEPRALQTDSDLQHMAALVRRFPEDNLHCFDLPYRLTSWALDEPENARLWFDSQGQLAGWAILQTPFWAIDCAFHPEAERDLHPEALAWADGRARAILDTPYGRPAWFVNVFAGQDGRTGDLEAAGFASQAGVREDPWSKVLMQRPADLPVAPYAPPAGFTVRPLGGVDEVEAYVDLHRSVFESENMTAGWRRRTLQHPDYRPELDVVVAAPDGRLAAFCVCWLGADSAGRPAGQIEPLGCHKEFRRYALGRVALAEGIRRLQSCGARSISVETDSYRNTALLLYESLGFRPARDVLVYRKDYPG